MTRGRNDNLQPEIGNRLSICGDRAIPQSGIYLAIGNRLRFRRSRDSSQFSDFQITADR
jgi:hypothetical protein